MSKRTLRSVVLVFGIALTAFVVWKAWKDDGGHQSATTRVSMATDGGEPIQGELIFVNNTVNTSTGFDSGRS